MSRYSTVLDIGSSKVICLICSVAQSGGFTVRGAGVREYPGYRRGVFSDVKQLSDAIYDAVSMAEQESHQRVHELCVGVPAPFMRTAISEGTLTMKKGRRITQHDIDAALSASLDFEHPQGFELMHSTPIDFRIGDETRQDIPLGVMASELSADVSHAFVDGNFKRVVSDALMRVGQDPDMYIGVPLSEGLFVIPDQDRAQGALLIDSGGTHTDVSYLKGQALISCTSIDVGGWHFTNDLTYGLQTQNTVAENVKRRYVYSLNYQDSIDTIRTASGNTIYVEHAAIQYIIEARTRELAGLIAEAINDMGVTITPKLPVYLTGGGISLMRGSCEFLEKELGVPIQVRMPWMPRLSSPNYASVFSVMDFVTKAGEAGNSGMLHAETGTGRFIKKLRDFFTK